jgi:hypothetical protein
MNKNNEIRRGKAMKAQKLRGREISNIVKIIALLIMIFSTSDATAIWIDSVDVIPEQPLEIDIITFDIFGTASGRPSQVAYDQFTRDGTSLQLDLYVDVGVMPAFSNWTYSKQIQPLQPTTYSLTVRAFDNYSGTLQDTYPVDFTVVPEPATILLLGFGAVLVKKGDQL